MFAVVIVVPSLLLTAGRVIRPAPVVTSDVFPLLRAAAFLESRSASERGAAVLGRKDIGALAEGIESAIAGISWFDAARIAADALVRFGPEAVGAQLVSVYREAIGGSIHA